MTNHWNIFDISLKKWHSPIGTANSIAQIPWLREFFILLLLYYSISYLWFLAKKSVNSLYEHLVCVLTVFYLICDVLTSFCFVMIEHLRQIQTSKTFLRHKLVPILTFMSLFLLDQRWKNCNCDTFLTGKYLFSKNLQFLYIWFFLYHN